MHPGTVISGVKVTDHNCCGITSVWSPGEISDQWGGSTHNVDMLHRRLTHNPCGVKRDLRRHDEVNP